MRRSAVIPLAFAVLPGCSWYVYDATHRPVASHIVGQCFALREDAILSEHFSYFTGYLLNLPGANECVPRDVPPGARDEERYKPSGLRLPRCTYVPVAKVAKGTQFKIANVTEQPWGGPGRCWKVDVTIITGTSAGIVSGIPSCLFDFPQSELWVRTRPDHQYVEPLELSDRIAVPCAEDHN